MADLHDEITKMMVTVVQEPAAAANPPSKETRERLDEIMEALLTSCKEAHELHKQPPPPMPSSTNLDVGTLVERLNRAYLSLKNGGKPSDYEQ